MDFLEQGAREGISKALVEKLAKVDRLVADLQTIHEDLADGIEFTAEKLEQLLKPINDAVSTLHKEIELLKAAKPPEIKIPEVDLSTIEKGLQALASVPPVDLGPVLQALNKLANRKPEPVTEEWVFDVEREKSGRIETVNAKRVA